MASIGENIKRLREKNGLSQSDLASKVGKTRTAIWQYERGDTIPRMGVIEDMAKLFDVPKGEIIESTVNYAIVNIRDDEEQELIKLYRQLPKNAKKALIAGLREYSEG